MDSKMCSKCHQVKSLDEFGPERRSADRHRYDCKICERDRHREYRESHREERRAARKLRYQEFPEWEKNASMLYRMRYPWKTMMQHAKKRALKLGLPYDLDSHEDELRDRLAPMICEMTGLPMISSTGVGNPGSRYWNSPTLDRIDPAKGYVFSNVRIICWALNCALGPWGEDILKTVVGAWLNKE